LGYDSLASKEVEFESSLIERNTAPDSTAVFLRPVLGVPYFWDTPRMAGRATDTRPSNGKEVHLAQSRLSTSRPPCDWMRVKVLRPRGFVSLIEERFMSQSVITGISAQTTHVTIIDGVPTTTTHDIAVAFGKRHDHVVTIVRQRMADAGEWGIRNFTDTPYINPQNGQTYPVIQMTEKGFMFVVQKFTGKKAVSVQIAYVDEFERMRNSLKVITEVKHPVSIPSPVKRQIKSREDLSFTQRDREGRMINWSVPPLDKHESWSDGVELGKHFFCEVVELATNNPKEAINAIRFAFMADEPLANGSGFGNRGRGVECGFVDSLAQAVVDGIRLRTETKAITV